MNNKINIKIKNILDKWAIKYDFPLDKHKKCKKKLIKPLSELLSNIHRYKRPVWMDELSIDAEDSFTYALKFAEDAYVNMITTSIDLDCIKENLLASQANLCKINESVRSLSSLASSIEKDYSKLNKNIHSKNR